MVTMSKEQHEEIIRLLDENFAYIQEVEYMLNGKNLDGIMKEMATLKKLLVFEKDKNNDMAKMVKILQRKIKEMEKEGRVGTRGGMPV